ncbi:MAG: hypothetical protein AAGK01_08095 [Pseudomonadota bacterium]
MFPADIWGTVSDAALVFLAGGTLWAAWIQIKKAGEFARDQIETSNTNNLAQIEASAKQNQAQLEAAAKANTAQIEAAAAQSREQIEAAANQSQAQIEAAIQNNLEQLKAAAKASQDQAQIARATLLLEIDRDFESPFMQESRMALRGLRNEIEALCSELYGYKTGKEQDDICHRLFSEYMNKVWSDFQQADEPPVIPEGATEAALLTAMKDRHIEKVNEDHTDIQPHEKAGRHYQRLMRLLGWLERVGHMVNEGLLPERDIIKLYDVIFVKMGSQFEGHIDDRRKKGNNDLFMKEFMNFRTRIIKLREQEKLAEEEAEKSRNDAKRKGIFPKKS